MISHPRKFQLTPTLLRHPPSRVLKNSILFLFLGGAAVHRCDNRLIFMTALAAEVTLSAREPVFPPPAQDAPPSNRSSVTHALDSPNLIADDQPKGPASTHSTQPPEPIHEFARPAIL